MPESFQGGCACGAIRYESISKPVVSFNCHCRACQRYTGSAFISGVLVPANAFGLTRGEPTYYIVQGDSGGDISRGFCAVCG
ncbi:MAG: GFA family protein, partial [Candidatus Binatia bacterium]